MTALGLVVAQFYEELAAEMEAEARETVEQQDAHVADTVHVPGVYDTPLAADRLARQDRIDAVAVLGVVVTGDTDHDQVVTHAAARRLSDVGLRRDTPVTFGVAGPDMSAAEAHERIEKCASAAEAAIDLTDALPARGQQ